MNRSSSADDSNDTRIVLSLGMPEDDTLYLRVSPQEGEEIRSLLEAEGLFAGEALEHSAGPELLIYVASIGSGLTGLAAVMHAYFRRNRHKSIKLSFEDRSAEMKGQSKKDSAEIIDRFLRDAQEAQARKDAEWRRMLDGYTENH